MSLESDDVEAKPRKSEDKLSVEYERCYFSPQKHIIINIPPAIYFSYIDIHH